MKAVLEPGISPEKYLILCHPLPSLQTEQLSDCLNLTFFSSCLSFMTGEESMSTNCASKKALKRRFTMWVMVPKDNSVMWKQTCDLNKSACPRWTQNQSQVQTQVFGPGTDTGLNPEMLPSRLFCLQVSKMQYCIEEHHSVEVMRYRATLWWQKLWKPVIWEQWAFKMPQEQLDMIALLEHGENKRRTEHLTSWVRVVH